MINIPRQNPRKAAAVALALGVTSILVGRFLPAELATWTQVLDLIGATLGGVGSIQIVKAPT